MNSTRHLPTVALALTTLMAVALTTCLEAKSASADDIPGNKTGSAIMHVVSGPVPDLLPISAPPSDPDPSIDTSGLRVNLKELDPATELLPGWSVGDILNPPSQGQTIDGMYQQAYQQAIMEQFIQFLTSMIENLMKSFLSLFVFR